MAERRAAIDSRKAMREAYKARSVAAAQFRMAARAARGLHKLAMSTDNYKHVPEHLRFVVEKTMQTIALQDAGGFHMLFDKRQAQDMADRYGRMAAKDKGNDSVLDTDSENPFVMMMNQMLDSYQALNELRESFRTGKVTRLEVYKRQAIIGEAMKEAMRGMLKTVKNENSMFREGRQVSLNEIGEAAMAELEAMPDRYEVSGKVG